MRLSQPFSGLIELIRNPLRIMGAALLLLILYAAITNITGCDFSGCNPDGSRYDLRTFISQFIFGMAQGSIYALIALGYTLVYGILFMINFAHGEVFMTGAYIGFFAIHVMSETGFLEDQTFLALVFTLLVGILASVVISILLERIAYRPLRNSPRLVALITAIGASITLQQLFLLLFGSQARSYPRVHYFVLPGIAGCEIEDGAEICPGIDLINGIYRVEMLGEQILLRPIYFVVLFVALGLMAMLWAFIQRTKTGKAMRAVAEDKDTAALMGINVDRVILVTFILGAAMAGAAAVLFALYNRQVTPFMGFSPGIKAFAAAVLGGIGNVPGAMFGGLFLGVTESVLPSMIGMSNQLKPLISFGLLVIVLIFRPTGIFGEVLSDKKA